MADNERFVDAPEDHSLSTSLASVPSRKSDGHGYIDQPPARVETGQDALDDAHSTSGSSVEEEDTEEEWEPPASQKITIEGEEHFGTFDHNDFFPPPNQNEYEDEDEDDSEDWAVDDEDWELASGDFTKQYNRIRQTHAATNPVPKVTSSRLDQPPQATTRPPLPARNVHPPRPAKATTSTSSQSKRMINPVLLSTGGVAANPKSAQERQNSKDKSDRATSEQVLDARTRLVLSGLVNRGIVGKIEGCANVYHALPSANPPSVPIPFPDSLALKIYRTSILNFKARQSYIVGEHRFRGGYASSHNPRKMVRLWAEKELRNLRRLEQGGIRAPRVVEGRENVLVMEFLGIVDHKLAGLYAELLVAMRRMYHHCKLVHADLSEYNILYHASHLWIIDVSQSVEHDHPRSFDFLRSDIRNVDDFFTRRSGGEVRTLGVRRTWNFVVDETVGGLTREEETGHEGEERLLEVVRLCLETVDPGNDSIDDPSTIAEASEAAALKASDDAVFMSSYIPRNLGEVYDPERDVDILRSGGGDNLIYAGLTGLDTLSGPSAPAFDAEEVESTPPSTKKGVRFDDDDDDDDVDDENENDEHEDEEDKRPRGFRYEDKEAKKERKKALKEENREKRKHKMPKAEKQKQIKKTSGK
ncbi:RIO kinase 1, partial [Tremellales sp. Uapishka_1]